jgi:magnesium transporter
MNIQEIDKFHLEDINSQSHPSVFFEHEKYDLFILNLPVKVEDDIKFISKSFIITDKEYLYFDNINNNLQDLNGIKGFYKVLDRSIDAVLKIISEYFSKIEAIEDGFYDNEVIKDFSQQWFMYKTKITRINRNLFRAIEALKDLMNLYKNERDYLERNFEDIHEHLLWAYRNPSFLLEKLDSLYNLNLTLNNEQVNRTIYILTLLSAIFLPLNLIVGFFGMNTTSLPFTVDIGGTYSVMFVLAIMSVLSTGLIYFIKKR